MDFLGIGQKVFASNISYIKSIDLYNITMTEKNNKNLSFCNFSRSIIVVLITKANILKLYIKYMVSIRCKMAVKAVLDSMGLHYKSVELGEIDIKEELTQEQLAELKGRLLVSSLLLMDDQKAMLIEKIKNVIIELVHYEDKWPNVNFSYYLRDKLHHDYAYMASLFSEVAGITIEHFIIAHKIEKVKELLLYDELTLTEISYKLHYSSVAHLSNQFKKVTGLTPSYFKNLKEYKKRIHLEEIGSCF